MMSTPASASRRTLARASSAPFTPQRKRSVLGYGACWMNGPETYRVGPGILPLLMLLRSAMLSSSGAPRSRALVMPASSSCFADAGMITVPSTPVLEFVYVLSQ